MTTPSSPLVWQSTPPAPGIWLRQNRHNGPIEGMRDIEVVTVSDNKTWDHKPSGCWGAVSDPAMGSGGVRVWWIGPFESEAAAEAAIPLVPTP